MIRLSVRLLNCLGGKHDRSEGDIVKSGGEYFSRCRYCRVPMRRRAKRDWIVDRDAPVG